MIETIVRGRQRRQRAATQPWQSLPALAGVRRDLLLRWARGNEPARRWATLRKLAGAAELESADALLEQLIEAGCVQVVEQFRAGRWWPQQVNWVELPRLQRVLGLKSQSDRDAERETALRTLDEIATATGALREAALGLMSAQLSTALLVSRTGLLQALTLWTADQRSGVRQDFALHARPHTKAITDAEWRWLESELDLTALGVERNAALLWLGGAMTLHTMSGTSSLQPWPFIGLPLDALRELTQVDSPPEFYWVIENRASFERQARRRERGTCVLWVPGRPSEAWLAAVALLLAWAPAPARVSADADPAGIEIALCVGTVWAQHGCAWQPFAMEPKRLTDGKALPLNDYDRASLARALGRDDLPAALRALAAAIESLGMKAEQEGWL
jgi:hypothetical protein